MSTRVTTRNNVQIHKESGWRICCILVLEKLKVSNIFLNVYFVARFILSSNSNNCCLLYFNANIMHSFSKKLKLLGDFRLPDPQSFFMSPQYSCEIDALAIDNISYEKRREQEQKNSKWLQFMCNCHRKICSTCDRALLYLLLQEIVKAPPKSVVWKNSW